MEQSKIDKQIQQHKQQRKSSFIQKKGANTFMGKTKNTNFFSSSPISQHKKETNSNNSFTFGNIPIIQNKLDTIQTVMGGGTGGKEVEEDAQMKANPLQRMEAEKEEEVQMKANPIQKQEVEEEAQMKTNPLQKQEVEEEAIQGKFEKPAQMMEEEEAMQGKFGEPVQKQESKPSSSNGLPAEVQAKMENGLGADFSNVNVHKESKSATDVGALAYAQGNDVHFAPGQFKPDTQAGQELIGHELTHVVQQREGRVKPTTQAKGMPVNDDKGLEKEADDMGKMAAQGKFTTNQNSILQQKNNNNTKQFNKQKGKKGAAKELSSITIKRKHINLGAEDKYGHWWTEFNGTESYGWWPKTSVGLTETLGGAEGELNGQTTFGGTATKDPHHGDSAEEILKVETTSTKDEADIITDMRNFANAYTGEWRWTFGFGQNCHTFQEQMLAASDVKIKS